VEATATKTLLPYWYRLLSREGQHFHNRRRRLTVFQKPFTVLFLALPVLLLALAACHSTQYEYPFRNPRLSFEERAADLVSRLTLEEKIAQMMNAAPAVERLNIPRYNWWNECLHGVMSKRYKVTVYPQAIGMAATWDAAAIKQTAGYTATEGRAVYTLAQVHGLGDVLHEGLTFWSPNINLFRDPRWGRGQETYGEDPFLTATLGAQFVRGLQGNDKRFLKVAACAKHYAVHSGPEASRHAFNSTATTYDLWDTYLPAFKTLVTEAGVAGVMCAYNALDGQPCCAHDTLTGILRNDWKFTGYVTSDCWAIDDFYNPHNHHTHPDAATASADAVMHGTDLECGTNAYKALLKAVADGLITEAQLDVSLIRLFTIRLRLGLFEPEGKAPFAGIDSTALELPAHKAHALKMARQSVVLLRNENNLLPINKETLRKIAVVGPNIKDSTVQLGNYNGYPSHAVTLLEGIRNAVSPEVEVYSSEAIAIQGEAAAGAFDSTLAHVADADLIIYAGGLNPRIEGEQGFADGDRTSIALPAIQTAYLKALHATGKPVVFVMMTGSAIAIPWESQHIPAIVNAWYGGEFAGTAVADVLFGNYNPSGHLPVTFYASDADLPPFEDYRMTNRTYKYFTGEPLYPFGYGLSFTAFGYEWASKPKAAYAPDGTIRCTVKLANTGNVDGDAVPQVYIKYPQAGRPLPLKELRYFERLPLDRGETAKVKIAIPVAQLAKWDDATGSLTVPSGEYTLFVGSHSADEALTATFTVN
jgi:beta-glucosidase